MTTTTVSGYILRIYKHASGNPDFAWVNTYEIANPSTETTGWLDLHGMCTIIANAEASFHTDVVVYERSTLSTWVPDSVPYNPLTFLTVEHTGIVGARSSGGNPMPRSVVLNVRKNVATGRAGKLHYRGALTDGEVSGNAALSWILDPDAQDTIQGLLDVFHDEFEAAVADVLGADAHMALISVVGTDTLYRVVTGLGVRGVTTNKPNHKYFDRA